MDQPCGAAWLCISTSLWVLLAIHKYLITIVNPDYNQSISDYFQLQGLLDQDEEETTSAASENQSENVSEAGDSSSMDVN